MQLLEDWWSESKSGCAAPCSPAGNEHHLASMFCKDECWGRVIDVWHKKLYFWPTLTSPSLFMLCSLFLLILPESRDNVWNFYIGFLCRKSVGALGPPQDKGSSTPQGRSPGHRWRNVAGGWDELPGGVFSVIGNMAFPSSRNKGKIISPPFTEYKFTGSLPGAQ